MVLHHDHGDGSGPHNDGHGDGDEQGLGLGEVLVRAPLNMIDHPHRTEDATVEKCVLRSLVKTDIPVGTVGERIPELFVDHLMFGPGDGGTVGMGEDTQLSNTFREPFVSGFAMEFEMLLTHTETGAFIIDHKGHGGA